MVRSRDHAEPDPERQSAHNAFAQTVLEVETRNQPTMRASAACRLGIAAYGLPNVCRSALEWLTPSTNPSPGNIHGGAVGIRAKPMRPMRFASRIVLRKRLNRSCLLRYTQSSVRPMTMNSEFQFV